MDKRYSISDASKQVLVENHVLRYWEEELNINIERNAQGHRYYTERDIYLFKAVKDLKEQGFQLKAIKIILSDIERVRNMHPQELYKLREELNQRVQREEEMQRVIPLNPSVAQKTEVVALTTEEKARKLEKILMSMIKSVTAENEKAAEERIFENVNTRVMKEIDYRMRQKDEIHEKELSLLKQILDEVKHEASSDIAVAATKEMPNTKTNNKRKRVKKAKKRKLFAKTSI